jgi:hypothetical protein
MITVANSRGLFVIFSIIIPEVLPIPCCAERLITLNKKMVKTTTGFFINIIVLNKDRKFLTMITNDFVEIWE